MWKDPLYRWIIFPLCVICLLFVAIISYGNYHFLIFPDKPFIFRHPDRLKIAIACFDGKPPIVQVINNKVATLSCNYGRAKAVFGCDDPNQDVQWNPSDSKPTGKVRLGRNTCWETFVSCR
jgi:hypothetical protein